MQEQYDAGRTAAAKASNDGEIALEDKPFGQTSPEVYPFTYWYVKGWNDYAGENR